MMPLTTIALLGVHQRKIYQIKPERQVDMSVTKLISFIHKKCCTWGIVRGQGGESTPPPSYLTICFWGKRRPNYTRKNLTTCNKSADKPSTRCVRTACTKFVNKLFQTCWQLVTSLTKMSDLLQGCSNKSDTILL